MTSNLLLAILNIKSFDTNDLSVYSSKYHIRINSAGEKLEYYIKDSFCGSFDCDESIKKELHSQVFSYFGNQNNPPDVILIGSDAIEIKKIESINASTIALNSSYPKSKLYSDSPMITAGCKNCETNLTNPKGWHQKDMIYAVGHVISEKIKLLTFVYGDCYAASEETYKNAIESVKMGVLSTGLEFVPSTEIGRINRVDPLGITYFRIRGMWGIDTPKKVFEDVIKYDKKDQFTVAAIMRREKYESFPEEHRKRAEEKLEVSNIKIRNPDNPANLLDGKLVAYRRRE